MSSLSYKTRISTPQLKVTITHNLNIPDSEIQPSMQQSGLRPTKQRTYSVRRPKDIDILPYSPQLCFLVSGSVDGKTVSPEKMCGSGIGRHLLECMRRNADFLGIHNISDINIEKMTPIISFTSSHPFSEIPSSPNLTFVSLKLKYAWITDTKGNPSGVRRTGVTSKPQPTSVDNPVMSPRIGPFGILLDQVACRLFSHHILLHYPLIFGPYSRFIRAEKALFPTISQSLRSIIKRSKNMQLKYQALASIEQIRTQNISRMRVARKATRELDPSISVANSGSDNEETEKNPLEEFTRIIGLGLTSMFQRCIKPWTKGLDIRTHANIDQDITTAPDPSGVMDPSPNTITLWKYLEEDDLLASQQGNDLWIEDQGEMLDLDCDDSQDDSAKEDEDCFLDMRYSAEGLLMPYFSLHPSLSDSDFVGERQMGWGSTAAPGELSLDLDSEDESMACFFDESHDFLDAQANLPSHELSPLRQPIYSSLLLPDPAHSPNKLSHDHEVVLKGPGLPESLDVCIHRDKASNSFPFVNLDFGLEDVDSDMEVFDFEPPVIAENSIGDSFNINYSPDGFSSAYQRR